MRGLRNKLNLLEDSDFNIVNKKEIKIMTVDIMKKNFKNKKKKTKDYGAKNPVVAIKLPDFCGKLIEYNMPKEMADDIIREHMEHKGKGSGQEVLCEYVNEQCGLLGYCIKVHVY